MASPKLYAAGLLVGVFAAGALGGGATWAAWGGHWTSGHHNRQENSYADRLQRDLGLTATQHDSIQKIVASHQAQIRQLWEEMRPRMDSIRTEIRGEIMPVLTSEQQTRYQVLIARSDSARAGHGRGSHAR